MRNGNGRTPPIKVKRKRGRYVIVEGRHRWAAHWIAGHTHIRAKVK
jgi:ParB-like chromosome segregation protein Spo0J